MIMKKINIIGQKFGRLTVLEEYRKYDESGRSRLFEICICECGNQAHVEKSKLLRGYTKSCGCLLKEAQAGLGSRFKKEYGVAAFNECYAAYKKVQRKEITHLNYLKKNLKIL